MSDQLPPCPVLVCGQAVLSFYSLATHYIRCKCGFELRYGLVSGFSNDAENRYRALCAAVDAGRRVPELEKEIVRLKRGLTDALAYLDKGQGPFRKSDSDRLHKLLDPNYETLSERRKRIKIEIEMADRQQEAP